LRTFALAAAVTAPAIATADEVPPPPEVRYAQTNREAERRGREILEQARFMARAADLLKEYAAPEPWSSNAGWIVAQRQTPVARFIVEDTSWGRVSATEDPRFENALGFALTSPKASTPNELHVYLSLTQPLPLFITTDSGVWIVKSGTIAFGQPAPTSEEP